MGHSSKAVRLPLESLEVGEVGLPVAAGRYLARIRRVEVGDRLVVFDPREQLEADAERLPDRAKQVWIRVAEIHPAQHVARQPLVLLQSWPKGAKLDAVVRAATELAATQVVMLRSERSVPTRLGAGLLDRLRRISVEAARQCGRGDVPQLLVAASLAEALEITRDAARQGLALALHPDAEQPLAQVLMAREPETPDARPLLLAVGPEGGFATAEAAQLEAAQFLPVRLGPFVMRTETAAIAGLAALNAWSAANY